MSGSTVLRLMLVATCGVMMAVGSSAANAEAGPSGTCIVVQDMKAYIYGDGWPAARKHNNGMCYAEWQTENVHYGEYSGHSEDYNGYHDHGTTGDAHYMCE